MLTGKELKLYNALAPYANDKGVEIVTVEVVGSKKAPTIRIFIDCEGGVGFDELSSDTSVLLEVDGITESLPYEQIKKAHVIGTIDFSA